MIKRFLIGVICLLAQMKSDAQSTAFPPMHIQHITTNDGLSDIAVYSIMQDEYGFMWMLTGTGLQRYDGYTFKTYLYSAEHPDYIVSGWYANMREDHKGIFWISDYNSGMWSFNPVEETFKHFVHDNRNNNSLNSNQTNGLVVSKDNHIWIATHDGLDEYNPLTGEFKHFNHRLNDSTSISDNWVMSICGDEEGNLWVVTISPGVDYFNTESGQVLHHYSYGSKEGIVNPDSIYSVSQGRNGNIWIGSRSSGLFCYNTRTKKARHFQHDAADPYSYSQLDAAAIYEDHACNLWIASDSTGFDFYQHATGKFFHSSAINVAFNSNSVAGDFLEDSSHRMWMVLLDDIGIVDANGKPFTLYQHNDDDPQSLSSNFAVCVLRDKQGHLFFGSSGVDILNEATRKFSQFKIMEHDKNVLENQSIWEIFQDSKGIIWFCTDGGLASYDPVSYKHRWYVHNAYDSTSLSNQSADGIIEDQKGRIWVTTWGGGLDLFDPLTGKFRVLNVSNSGISSNSIGHPVIDFRGLIYIPTQNAGLDVFNPDNESFKIYHHDKNNPNSISSDVVMEMMQDRRRIIWVGTSGGGFCAFDPSTEKFRAFTMKDGLPSDETESINEDHNGNLWIGTVKGISCFTPPENPFDLKSKFRFRNYSVSDGLPANEITFFGGSEDTDETLYFGTTSAGFFSFKPDELKDNPFVPPVYIVDFKLFNHSVSANDSTHVLVSHIESTKQVTLSYKQNVISFEFAALNFFHPEKNQYAYKLDGFDKDWTYTDAAHRSANYTNLDAGDYTFEVMGSNNDGVWNETPTILHLIIAPPYWQTWWFRTGIILAALSLTYGIYRYRLQEVIRLQNIRNKISGDLHDDIGSTLNSISVYSEVAKQDPAKHAQALEMIGQASRKIIDAMSDIVWTINPENDSFESIIERMRSLAFNLFRTRNIEFTFRADENLNDKKLSIEDRRNLFLIFKEAINNLVKYAEASRVSIQLTQENSRITLLIRDNGKGFDMNNHAEGNGLNSIKRRAKEMKADLRIESTVGNGTSVELKMKV